MEAISIANHPTAHLTAPGRLPVGASSRPDLDRPPGHEDPELRRRIGEFVGDVFYGTLIRQMHASTLKGEYFHGGRGEDVFQGQLGMELAQRLGRAVDDPIANRMYEAWVQRQTAARGGSAAVSPGNTVPAHTEEKS